MFIDFLTTSGWIYLGLAACSIFSRLAFALTPRVTEAPWLDFFVSLFTWLPWLAGALMAGWMGVLAAVVAQFFFLHTFCICHRALHRKKGRTLTDAQAKLIGPLRNQLALLVTTPAVVVFLCVRIGELFLYPWLVLLARLPSYRHSEWVNLSRHRYQGLAGSDLLWCWYCDWMTGVWSLGGEMLRNVESFWCPIRFQSEAKNRNISVDFPDVHEWAPPDATLDDAVRLFEKHYQPGKPNRWWGHPDRNDDPP